jgi:DNA-binding transcriptional LysR family regulator
MQLQQVRYFLSIAATLNFTRAAEMCAVTQPALTRAIKALEYELGGQLITREGRLSHLTELGQRVLPILERTYRSALAAKALARSCSDGAALRLGITGAIDLERIIVPLGNVIANFPNVEIHVVRGSAEELLEHLRYGDADLVVSDSDLGGWERLDAWLVDRVPYSLVVNRLHRFATHQPVQSTDVALERLICLPYCSLARELLDLAAPEQRKVCQVSTLGDIFTLLKLNAGVALLPKAIELPDGLVKVETRGFPLEHSTHLYSVAGRRRTTCVNIFVNHFARTHSGEASDDIVLSPAPIEGAQLAAA